MDLMAASELSAPFNGISSTPETAQDTTQEQQPPATDKQFQKAIATWRGIGLSTLIPQLDATASEVVAHQRDSLVQRKDLAQKTKDFRKLDDARKLEECKSLLKAYQSFIDLITAHGKTSSSAFLQIYSSLSDAPDPYPLLEACVESLVLSEETLPKLTAGTEQLQRSNNKLTAQLEDTETRLEEERTARKRLEDNEEIKVKEVEAAWTRVVEENQSSWKAKEQALEEKIENQDGLLKELKASHEVSQRLGQNAESDSISRAAAAAELDIVSSELEKTSGRLAEIEVRNEQLRLDLAQALSKTHSNHIAEDDPALLRLQSENSSLLRKLEAARLDKEGEMREQESKLRHLERQRAQLDADNHDLRARIQKWSDYDEIRRELDVISSIEFSTGDDDELEGHAMNGRADGQKESLEQLLLTRNKKLSDELTVLRISHKDLQQQLSNLQEELSSTNAELEKSQKLSTTLEDDLLKVQEEVSNAIPSSGMSVAGTHRYPMSSRRGRVSPTSSIISGFETVRTPPSLENLRAGEPVGGGSGILPMIQAQRDRFKQKNAQLEEELSKTYASVTSLRQEVASLQKDNLSLYEKTRYTSTYNRGQQSTSSSAYSKGPSHASIQMSDDGQALDRYKSQYEANISPFAAFRGRESVRAYKRMSFVERMILSVTRMVLATRTSRNLFAGYCLALHLMVFVMLYWMGSVDMKKSPHLTDAAGAAAVLAGARNGQAGQESGHGEWLQEGFQGG